MEHHKKRRHEPEVRVFAFDYFFLDAQGNRAPRDRRQEGKVVVKVLVAHDTIDPGAILRA